MIEPGEVVSESDGRESAADWFRRIRDLHDGVFSAEPFVWCRRCHRNTRRNQGT
ncbi:hypothetical protein [Streptomyces sp. NPDC050388]|uniref:hypothetical protein n=1 Tax=Streptomyces sp. NPDC050388 TaxID=3155781 RepID=UPI00341576D4